MRVAGPATLLLLAVALVSASASAPVTPPASSLALRNVRTNGQLQANVKALGAADLAVEGVSRGGAAAKVVAAPSNLRHTLKVGEIRWE
jgi:hypothetical protein